MLRELPPESDQQLHTENWCANECFALTEDILVLKHKV